MSSLIYIAIGTGLAIGILGAFFTRSKSYGILINIISGIIGSIAGVWTMGQIHFSFDDDKFLSCLIASSLLSIILVWITALLRRKG